MQDEFFKKYFKLIKSNLDHTKIDDLKKVAQLTIQTSDRGNKVIIAGNGGSAAMASHVSVDFTKAAGIRAVNFNEADLLTCFANDYGYERVFEKAVEFYGDNGDLLILISSSGSSINVVNAAKRAKELNMSVITFSGFNKDNALQKLGDVSFWVDSKAYNIVEMTHHIWLVAIVDYIIGDIEYSAS